MELYPINSSSISAAGYDPETRILRIRFTSLAEYEYYDFPPECWQAFKATPSKGGYHAARIIGQYAYKCVVERPKQEKKPEAKEAKAKPKAKAKPAAI